MLQPLRAHVLCYVFRVPPPSLHRDLAIQSVSLKVVTWSDFWPAAGEKFRILDHPTLLKCVVFVVQTVEYEPKMLKNFRLTAAEASKIVINYSFIVYHADSEKFIRPSRFAIRDTS